MGEKGIGFEGGEKLSTGLKPGLQGWSPVAFLPGRIRRPRRSVGAELVAVQLQAVPLRIVQQLHQPQQKRALELTAR